MKNTHKFLSILFAVVVIAAFVVVPVGASDGTPPDPAVFDVGLIVQLLQGLALAIFPVLAVQAARWANAQIALVRSKMTEEQERLLDAFIYTSIYAAEQLGFKGYITNKLDYVTDLVATWLFARGWEFDFDEIRARIESMVAQEFNLAKLAAK